MQVRKIDCKLTRQRNQSSSPEKRLISLQFFIWYFLRCGNSNKKNLRAVTKTTVTTWAESHWGFESLSYSICQPKLPGTRQTLVYSFLLRSCTCLRHADDHGDLHAPGVYAYCVCVPVSVGPVCHVALTSFEAVPIPQSAVSRPSPTSSTRPRKVVALVCIRSCALQCFIKTRVWLKASTATPSDTERGTV